MDADLLIHRLLPLAPPVDVLAARATWAGGWPLFGTLANRQLEAGAARELPAHTLMQRAGAAAARLALALCPHAQQVSVLVGPGNNGGDGLELALHLHQQGLPVRAFLVLEPSAEDPASHPWPADAAAALARAQAAQVPLHAFDVAAMPAPPSGSPHLIVDALLGRGLRRPAAGRLREAIEWANAQVAHGRRTGGEGNVLLSIDQPSGLPSDTGECPPGAVCVQATDTLALLSLAPGLFTAQGRDASGRIWFHDLAVTPTEDLTPSAWLASPAQLAAAWPARRHAQHKGSFGDVVVVGGASGMAGAALLAARAALVAGAGRVYLAGLGQDAHPISDPVTPELMRTPAQALWSAPARWKTATFVAGCGGGTAIEAVLPASLRHAERLVLDADALNAIARQAPLQAALGARAERGLTTVLTPHPLEAARLLGCQASDVQTDRVAAARRLAERFACVVVLKGSGSVVARPEGDDTGEREGAARVSAWIVPCGNAALGTPGSGDVLAGLLGSLWSQRSGELDALTEPGARRQRLQAVAATAVALHGDTAEGLRPDGAALPASALITGLTGRTPHGLRR